ncbi:down-regulator of transcription 1 [Paragonimus westermani]|uniref:Protein Dr1 n=1 Tax=Paragonimus westermani TaxID=34504 RepID=A0A5J4NCU4_9TREM|nr:down-regulator of transcription 1 [Paragonimus westermani]
MSCKFVSGALNYHRNADEEEDLQCKEEDEVSIPRAALNKFIKDIVPDARLTTETRELLLNCCHAFIHKLATQANIACAMAKKKTISPEHIFQGLDAMNLSVYKQFAMEASEEAKEELKGRRMLSASYRFKHQDNEERERSNRGSANPICDFQLQARADFVGEQLNKDDLLAASELAAADAAALTLSSHMISNDANNNGATSGSSSLAHAAPDSSSMPMFTGTGRMLGMLSVEDDDNYDE